MLALLAAELALPVLLGTAVLALLGSLLAVLGLLPALLGLLPAELGSLAGSVLALLTLVTLLTPELSAALLTHPLLALPRTVLLSGLPALLLTLLPAELGSLTSLLTPVLALLTHALLAPLRTELPSGLALLGHPLLALTALLRPVLVLLAVLLGATELALL